MSTTFLIIGLIVLSIVIFIIYRILKVKAQNRKLNQERFERIQPLLMNRIGLLKTVGF
jgi:uncharacterized membrane protein YsdA (DUF1294 family)